MEALAGLTAELDRRGIDVELVADEWCNTLEDIKLFADHKAGHMIQIKTPDLGGINNTIGICFSVLLVGVVRELLAEGTVFGNVVFPVAPLPLADQPGTGFIIIGLIAAVWTAIGGAYVHYKIEEVRHLYGNKRKR